MKPAVTKTPSMFWHILWLQTGGMEFERHGQTCCSIIQLHCKIQWFFLETDYALQSTILWLTKRDLRLPLQNCLITPKIAVSQIDPPIRKACLEFHWMWDLSWIHTWEYCMSNLWQALSHWFVTPVSVNVCILPAIKETLYISAHYNWALMIEDWMRPPVSSEMEIWEVSNAMREIYGSYLKLIDAFGLHRGSVCIGMFCVSVGADDHAANQWVLGLLLKIEKRNNNSHNVGTEREGRSGIKHGMWVITDIKLNNHIL